MLEEIYLWLRNISFCLVILSAVMYAVPGSSYMKYIRFFTGLVLVILMFTPVLRITGMEQDFRSIYKNAEYKINKEEIERAEELLRQSGIEDISGNEEENYESSDVDKTEKIEVEEIKIEGQ